MVCRAWQHRADRAFVGENGALSVHRLQDRIAPEGADRKFRRIIDSYNGMLGRLERSYQQAIRFSADASHELKTPPPLCAPPWSTR
jgi:signal transduction histidine kinase